MVAHSGGHHHDHGSGHDEDAGHDAREHSGQAGHHDAGAKTGMGHVHADGNRHKHNPEGERK